jgi:hypothetical protein
MQSSEKQFGPLISVEEYEKQKKEYTEKALKDLQIQMKYIKPKKTFISEELDDFPEGEDDYINNSSDELEDLSASNVNLIINNYRDFKDSKDSKDSNGKIQKKKQAIAKLQDSNITSTIYAQRELDLQEIAKLKTIIKKLDSTLYEENKKNHFLKLDLNNAQVDCNKLQEDILLYRDENAKLKKENCNNWILIIGLKLLLVIFVLQFLYSCF